MPLGRKGRKVKRAMQQEYGTARGARIFYAWENKHKRAARRRKRG